MINIRIKKSICNESLLTEARVKDIKKKYPNINNSGWIDYGRSAIEDIMGPKGVSKYLLWYTKALESEFYEDEDFWENAKEDPEVKEIADVLLDLVIKFQENQQRLDQKDIYKYEVSDLQQTLDKLGLSSSKKRKKEKEEAVEGSEIVYDDNDIFAVRPYEEGASCYYGKNTRWCISATQSRNYFSEYTDRMKAFVMVRFENLEEDDPYKKVAMVFDDLGAFEEAYDSPDEEIGYSGVRKAVAKNWAAGEKGLSVDPKMPYSALDDEDQDKVDKILASLLKYSAENVMDNPPEGEDLDEKISDLEQQYENVITNGYYSADNEGDGNVYFSGGFSFEFENLSDDFPTDWRELDEAGGDLRGLLDRELQVYASEVRMDTSSSQKLGKSVNIYVDIGTDEYMPNISGYEGFLEEMETYDKKYKAMNRLFQKYFSDVMGWMGSTEYDSFAADVGELSKNLDNFSVSQDSNIGDEEILFNSAPFVIPNVGYEFIRDEGNESKDVNSKLAKAITGLNNKIISFLKKQLPLPGIPQAKLKEFTIPEMLSVRLFFEDSKVKARIRLLIDDVSITKESLNAIKDVVGFIDSNFKEVAEMAMKIIQAENEIVVQKYALQELKKRVKKAIEEELIKKLSEKKDACYHKVKSRYKVWPSAYASGALVKCRKVGAKNWGNSKKQNEETETPVEEKRKLTKKPGSESNLGDWFKRKGEKGSKGGWVDCNTCRTKDGKTTCKSCGRSSGEKRSKFPACRPTPSACKTKGKGKKWGKKAK